MEIGRIAIVAASIEDIFHLLHWQFAGLSDSIGPIITADVKPNRLTEDILRIAKIAKLDPAGAQDAPTPWLGK